MLRAQAPGRVVEEIFRHGRRYSSSKITVLVCDGDSFDPPAGLVAAIAGRKIGGAVIRNRAKRVIKEAVRLSGGPWGGFRIAIIARHSLENTTPSEVASQLSGILRKSQVDRGPL